MRVRSLGWEDPLEEGMATQSSILAWRIPWTEEPGELQSMGCKEPDTTEAAEFKHVHVSTTPAPAMCSVSLFFSVWLLFLDGFKACIQLSTSSFIWASEGKRGSGERFLSRECMPYPQVLLP